MEQVNILCDQYPDNPVYQAQKASEMMQNGDHAQAIKMFDSILITILITLVHIPQKDMLKKLLEIQIKLSKAINLHIKLNLIMVKHTSHWQT